MKTLRLYHFSPLLVAFALVGCKDDAPSPKNVEVDGEAAPPEQSLPKVESILTIIERGMDVALIKKRFGEPDEVGLNYLTYRNWNPNIPMNAAREGLHTISIEINEEGKIVDWLQVSS